MSRSRFGRLTEYLHFNDNTAQGTVGSHEYDWLHKTRPFIEMTRRNVQRYMKPGQCQSIDEGMIRYKGHYFAKQYTPCKPIKRGMTLKNPTLSGCGDTEQLQHDNLVATAWEDAKPVHIVSTTSDPLGDGPTHCRVPGGKVILIQQLPAVAAYHENYYGVDRAMQYRSKCTIGRQSRKYFMNFILEGAITFLRWKMTPGVVKPRKHYSLGDLHVDVAMSLIEDFSNSKQPRHLGKQLITAVGLSEHHSMKLERRRGRCKWCALDGKRKDVVYGCDKCMVHLCQGACFQA